MAFSTSGASDGCDDDAAGGVANEKVGGSATIAPVSFAAAPNKFTWLDVAAAESEANEKADGGAGDSGDANMASDEGADVRSGERNETGELSAAAGAAATRCRRSSRSRAHRC